MNIVFDCMIFLQAAGRPGGPAFACFERVEQLGAKLCVSPAILLEVGEVMLRPKIRKRFPILNETSVSLFIRQVESRSLLIDEVPDVFPFPRDPKDKPYLDLAIACDAAYLVSRDRDILDLSSDESDFKKRLPNCRVLSPETFLRETESQKT